MGGYRMEFPLEVDVTFLTHGGQNIKLRNKSYEKKKFDHVLKGHVQLFFGQRPIVLGRRPTMCQKW